LWTLISPAFTACWIVGSAAFATCFAFEKVPEETLATAAISDRTSTLGAFVKVDEPLV
jgi:hypothetical protein